MRIKKTVKDLESEAAQLRLQENTKNVVVRPLFRDAKFYKNGMPVTAPQPEYGAPNMALAGILKRGETIEHFRERWLKTRIKQLNG